MFRKGVKSRLEFCNKVEAQVAAEAPATEDSLPTSTECEHERMPMKTRV